MASYVLSGACVVKAGANVAATINTQYVDYFIPQAEAYLNVLSRKNWNTVYATLDSDTKKILEEAVSNLAAIYAIQYDMSGYTSRVEAEDMINVLYARFIQCVQILQDQEAVTYLTGA